MYTVVYISTQTKPFAEDQFEALLKVSRASNVQAGITGLLLHKDENFMQFLEGPKDEVINLLGHIRKDQRHHSLVVIWENEELERVFPDWCMGFKRLDAGKIPAGFTDLWHLPFTSEEFLLRPSVCLSLMKSFRDSTH